LTVNTEFGSPWILGAGVALALLAHVLVFGRFLVLGALFGPIFERAFAQVGVYLTKKARDEYGGEKTATTGSHNQPVRDIPEKPTRPATDGGTATEVPDSTPVPSMGQNEDHARLQEKYETLEQRFETLQEVARERDDRIAELESQLTETEGEVDNLQSELESKQKTINEKENEVETLKGQLGLAARSIGDTGFGNAKPVIVPHPDKDTDVGIFWAVKRTEYDSTEFATRQPALLGAWDPSKLMDGKIPDPTQIPEQMGEEWLSSHEDLFVVSPDDYTEPIDFLDRDHRKYDPDTDNALIHGSWAEADSVAEMALEDLESPYDLPVLRLGVDMNGNPVRDRGDDSGELRQLRSRKKELKRQFRKMRSIAERRADNMEELQNELQIKREEVNDLRQDLENARQREREARQGITQIQQQAQVHRGRADLAEEEAEQWQREAEAAQRSRRVTQSQNLREGGSRELEQTKEQAKTGRQQKEIEIIEKIRPIHPNNDEIDWDRLDDPAYDKDRSEVIKGFVSMDENELPSDQAEMVQVEVMDMLSNGEVENGSL
jgi:predicted  nucleic acid-binding Zn-ribbon protein